MIMDELYRKSGKIMHNIWFWKAGLEWRLFVLEVRTWYCIGDMKYEKYFSSRLD